jgi:hypothetical protein
VVRVSASAAMRSRSTARGRRPPMRPCLRAGSKPAVTPLADADAPISAPFQRLHVLSDQPAEPCFYLLCSPLRKTLRKQAEFYVDGKVTICYFDPAVDGIGEKA